MDEFVNRMATQRYVLNVVNGSIQPGEKLFGLSANAIDRWVISNQIGAESEILKLLRNISGELFFIATRSQETVSREYEIRSSLIVRLVSNLEEKVLRFEPSPD